MINSSAKGRVGERAWANKLTSWGIEAKRGQQHKGGPNSPDVITPGLAIHWEVKYGYPITAMHPGTALLKNAMEQATSECVLNRPVVWKRPVVAWKPKGSSVWLLTWEGRGRVMLTAIATRELVLRLSDRDAPV